MLLKQLFVGMLAILIIGCTPQENNNSSNTTNQNDTGTVSKIDTTDETITNSTLTVTEQEDTDAVNAFMGDDLFEKPEDVVLGFHAIEQGDLGVKENIETAGPDILISTKAKDANVYEITLIWDNLKDDSLKAEREVTTLKKIGDKKYKAIQVQKSWKCWRGESAGKGWQTEPCV